MHRQVSYSQHRGEADWLDGYGTVRGMASGGRAARIDGALTVLQGRPLSSGSHAGSQGELPAWGVSGTSNFQAISQGLHTTYFSDLAGNASFRK